MKSNPLRLRILIFAAVVSAAATDVRASEAVRASIAAPGESIVHAVDGRRVLLFGEAPETIHFTGQMRGLSPACARYYWTFTAGTPARWPEHGTAARLNPGAVKFVGPGEACLHMVDRHGRELAEAKLAIGHLAFEYQDQSGDPANPVYTLIPEGAVLGPHDEIFVQATVVVKTDPPLPGVDLGRLSFDHPRRHRIAPDRVITDAHGAFATTLSGWIGNEKNSTWPVLSLETIQHTRDPQELARLRKQNEAIRHRDDPLKAQLTATPVEFYRVGMSGEKRGQIETNDGFQLGFPAWLSRHGFSESSSDLEKGSFHLQLDDLRRNGRVPIVHCSYPATVMEKLPLLAEDHGREGNPRRAEDGRYYLRIPEVRRVVYQVEAGEFLEAVTLRPRAGRLVALIHRPASGGHVIAEVDAQTGQLGRSFPVPDINCEYLTWMSDRYLLGTWYGRRWSSYSIIDLQKQRLVRSGNGEGDYELRRGRLIGDKGTSAPRVLFTLPK
ncbi:MAG TPA: hypothetical protein VGO11_14915 [Chthoniobacteraceae bacterium]|nr:hypothetical protein [Chthoniobacteraceae bacterium]